MISTTDLSATESVGQVVTFYSYKGGTGRSMALANVATLLAQRSEGEYESLMVDWDLEAPGLHKYFPIQAGGAPLNDRSRPGLIDLLERVSTESRQFERLESHAREREVRRIVDSITIGAYVTPTDVPHLHLMKAGKLDGAYGSKVNAFRWDEFYQRAPWSITALAEKLTREYRYVLVDSRTGLTDTSGICTMLLPEKLVVVFTPNAQSLDGVADLVERAIEHRRSSDDLRPLIVYPLPSRIETTEPGERDAWRLGSEQRRLQGWQRLFESLLTRVYDLKQCNLAPYFDEVQIPHQPYYAYGEKIAVQIERGTEIASLPKSYERFVEWLTNRSSAWEDPAVTAAAAAQREAQQLGRRAEATYAALATDADREIARRIFTRLVKILGEREVGEYARRIAEADDFAQDMPRSRAIIASFVEAGIVTLSGADGDANAQIADDRLIGAWSRLKGWIEKDRAFLSWRQVLGQHLDAWNDRDRDAGLLLRGRALQEAIRELETRAADFSPAERHYVSESRAYSESNVFPLQAPTSGEVPFPMPPATGHTGEAARRQPVGAPASLPASSRRARSVWMIGAAAAVLLTVAVAMPNYLGHDTTHAESVVSAAALAAASGDPVEASLLLATLDDRDGDAALERARVVAAMLLPTTIFASPQTGITSAAVSSSGRRVLTTSRDGLAVVSAMDSGFQTRAVYRHGRPLIRGSFSPDDRAVMLLDDAGAIVVLSDTTGIWSPASVRVGGRVTRLPSGPPTVAVAFAETGAAISVDRQGRVTAWRRSGCCTWSGMSGSAPRDSIRSAIFSEDGTRLATQSPRGRIHVHDIVASGAPSLADSSAVTFALSADGSHLATISRDGQVRLRDQLGRVVWEDRAPEITTVALSPFGSRIALSPAAGPARVLRPVDRSPVSEATSLGGSGAVTAIAFGADSSMLVTASDSNVRVWNLDAARPTSDASWPEIRKYFVSTARSCLSVETRMAALGEAQADAEQGAAACDSTSSSRIIASVEFAPDTMRMVSSGGSTSSRGTTTPVPVDSTAIRVAERLRRGLAWTGEWTRSDGDSVSIALDLRLEGRLINGTIRWSERRAPMAQRTGYPASGEGKVSGTFNSGRLELQLRVNAASPSPSSPLDLRLLVTDARLGLRGTIMSEDKVSGTFRGDPAAAARR